MFDIGWSELLVIGVVALIAIGPKELPGVLRMVGQWMGKIRRMASEFQGQFQEAMREAEMEDIKKQVDDMTSTATNVTSFDPLDSVRKEVDAMRDELSASFDAKPGDPPAATPTAATPPAIETATAPPAPEAVAPPAAPEPAAPPADGAPAKPVERP